MNEFEKLGLGKGILETLQKMKFEKPSEIQEKTIPLVLNGEDVIGQAATGSGKTLAFGAGIIQNMRKEKGVKALIMTPTRELAEQVAKAIKKFSENYNLEIADIYGGVAINPQIRALETADVVVGTPGRILDHINKRTLQLNKIQFLVLDEADRMVDMGFLPDVERILKECNKERQTLLFSATISPDISYVAKNYMRNPKQITVESYVDPTKLKQVYYDIPDYEKFSLFLHLVKQDSSHIAMVFCNTRGNVETLVSNLRRFDVQALGIHGGMNQAKRNKVMEDFFKQHFNVLVCTDVAARGLDIKNVSHVYNYDIPKDRTDYIHRIGRTARAGKEGKAISLVCSKDYLSFRRILEDDEIKIEREDAPEFERVKPLFAKDRQFDRPFRRFNSQGEKRNRYGTYRTGGSRSNDNSSGQSHRRSFGGRSNDSSGRRDSNDGRPRSRRGFSNNRSRFGGNFRRR